MANFIKEMGVLLFDGFNIFTIGNKNSINGYGDHYTK